MCSLYFIERIHWWCFPPFLFFSPTLESDLDSCQKESARQSATLTIVTIRFVILILPTNAFQPKYKAYTLILIYLYCKFYFFYFIRFYVFWCGWFQINIVEIKITIITVTFGLPSPTSAPTPTTTSLTTQSSSTASASSQGTSSLASSTNTSASVLSSSSSVNLTPSAETG